MAVTADEIRAGIEIVKAVAETVREVKRAPAGVVYAALMTRGVSLAGFEKIVGILERAEVVRRDGDVLVWIGPA